MYNIFSPIIIKMQIANADIGNWLFFYFIFEDFFIFTFLFLFLDFLHFFNTRDFYKRLLTTPTTHDFHPRPKTYDS